MKTASKVTKTSQTTDWAAKVRKFKPQLNSLTDAERRRLLKEAMADINSAEPAVPNVRRR